MSAPQHPGKVVFVNGVTGKLEREVDASTLPESVAFYFGLDGPQPVTKIVTMEQDGVCTIRSFGPGDVFLCTTTAFTGGRPPGAAR